MVVYKHCGELDRRRDEKGRLRGCQNLYALFDGPVRDAFPEASNKNPCGALGAHHIYGSIEGIKVRIDSLLGGDAVLCCKTKDGLEHLVPRINKKLGRMARKPHQ